MKGPVVRQKPMLTMAESSFSVRETAYDTPLVRPVLNACQAKVYEPKNSPHFYEVNRVYHRHHEMPPKHRPYRHLQHGVLLPGLHLPFHDSQLVYFMGISLT